MWWTCPGHADIRAEYPELMRADRSAWPPCMLHNGIAPLGWEQAPDGSDEQTQRAAMGRRKRLLHAVHCMMAAITVVRTDSNATTEKFTATRDVGQDYPWGWKPQGYTHVFCIMDAARYSTKRYEPSKSDRFPEADFDAFRT